MRPTSARLMTAWPLRVLIRHADLLDGYADAVGHDLGNARQRPLPLIGEARDAAHRARRFEPQGAAVLRGDRCAGRAVIGRAIGGLLAEGRNADAAVDAPRAQLRLFLAQRVVIHEPDELLQTFVE